MGYEKLDSKVRLEDFPAIEDVEEVTKQVNKLFTPYIFFQNHKKSVELWCSCCMKHGFMDVPPRTISDVEYELMYNKHNDYVTCPYCHRRAQYKNIGKLGKKKNLQEYKPVVILAEKDGDIYARAYWTRKLYQNTIDEAPSFYLVEAYHFTRGQATVYTDPETGDSSCSVSGNYDPVHRVITEPFTEGSWGWYRYTPYIVMGLDAIGKSSFRYCGYEDFEPGICARWGQETVQTRSNMMKYLAASSIYPRQIEMLMKTGFREIVYDLVCGRKKNKDIFDWSKDNYLEAFGLTKTEMNDWRESEADMKCIAIYKKLRRAGVPESFKSLKYLVQALPYTIDTSEFFRLCCRLELKPTKLFRYLSEGQLTIPKDNFQKYKDYIDMARQLGWDTDNETIKLPKDLHHRHDEAALEINEIIVKGGIINASDDLRQRMTKYNFELGDYFIRCALSANEVVSEGKTLQHCVGGYAQRHMSGKLTILFLRKKSEPYKSLYTIEMHGNRLIQIHGYKNDYKQADPRKTMAFILDSWLDWIEKGSKRDKEGNPKLPKKKKETAA